MYRVLLVDDERSILQALSFELEDDGYEVLNASNFDEAACCIAAFDCDLVISDLFFGADSNDGIQLLNRVRQKEREVPFIAMTAFPETNLALQAKNVLKDRFFVKPFSAVQLRRKVHELLKGQNHKTADC